jgi:hypothetical protein
MSSGYEDEQRTIRGPKEEAKRRNRGETDIRHRLSKTSSQLPEDIITF